VPIAAWKDLCVDAVDVDRMGPFWAETLGLEPRRLDDGDILLEGPTPQHRVWVNTVPEPVTVKQRVHLDVRATTTDEVVARGATPLDVGRLKWDVLRDPEGGELCVFHPREGQEAAPYKLFEVVVDASAAHEITAWWAEVLGATVQDSDREPFSWFEDAPGMPFTMVFQEVPEPKTVKNRIHWDVEAEDVQLLLDRGATLLREPDGVVSWHVLADPEGNEFCVFRPGQ
jgi:glyoxalase superfamily protein